MPGLFLNSKNDGSKTIASRVSALAPQIVGPIPISFDGPITTAPAPSAKINAVARSSGSVKSDNFSAPITKTFVAVLFRTKSLASATP